MTKVAVKHARLNEIRGELLNSQKLKVRVPSFMYHDLRTRILMCNGEKYLRTLLILQLYFKDNPRDQQVLRHDKRIGNKKIQEHLQNVPNYLGE